MTNIALYQLTGQYQQLLSTLSGLDLDAGCVADTLEASGLVDNITDKAVGIEMVARSLEMSVPAIDRELIRLESLKAQQILKAQGLRLYLRTNMQACGITKIESPLFKISLQNNPQSVDIYELGLIPGEYMRQPETPPPAPDKAAIKTALKEGINVQGARLIQSQRLAIK